MKRYLNRFVPLLISFSAVGLTLVGCNATPSKEVATRQADQDGFINDDDDKVTVATVTPRKASKDDALLDDSADQRNPPMVIAAKIVNQQAPFSALSPTTSMVTPGQQSALPPNQSLPPKNDPGKACVTGATRNIGFAVVGTGLYCAADFFITGGATCSIAVSNLPLTTVKAGALGCAGGLMTGNPNTAVGSVGPDFSRAPTRPTDIPVQSDDADLGDLSP